jgi:glycerol kinase
MQFQADILDAPVVLPEVTETTALGAAYLAGVATGLWSEDDTRAMRREARRFEPGMSADERESLLAGWSEALGRARGWASER